MKAVVGPRYGPPEALQLREVAKPIPLDNEVLIRTYAATVTIEDVMMRRSVGPGSGRQTKEVIPGNHIAGEVEAVGKSVRRFRKGDQVYGFTGWRRLGAFAEYTCVPENAALAQKPANMTHAEAVAIIDGGLTSLPFLRDRGKIERGRKVLVYGASGAVGTAAVQLARYFGAEVTGVCSTANLELVRGLGASKVIDYTMEDFSRSGETYDIIFDAVGKVPASRSMSALTSRGIYLSTIPMPGTLLRALWTAIPVGKKVRFMATGLRSARAKVKDLLVLKELAEAGELKAVIDRVYPLEQVVEAHRYVGQGHKKANVVISIREQAENGLIRAVSPF